MLSDPTSLRVQTTAGGTFALPAGTDVPFIRRAPGQFVSTSSPFSLDQQARLIVKAKSSVGTESSGLVRVEYDKNVAPINGISQRDKVLAVWVGFNGDLGHFTKADILNVLVMAVSGFQSNIDQILAGGT